MKIFAILKILLFLLILASSVAGHAQDSKTGPVNLTPAENAWLTDHKSIRVGISPIFPPLKFIENGVIKGIEPDYLQLLSELTGIKFDLVIADFTQLDAMVKSGKLDMFISFHIPNRLEYMTFTEPLMEFKQVIITRNDAPFISGIASLKGKRFAGVKGVKLYEKLMAPYPDINMVMFDSMDLMFRAVSEAKADALISKTIYAGYMMLNYPNLKIAGIAELPPEPYLYAIRKDYLELVSILNKGIKAIPKDRQEAIIQKWLNVRIEYKPNWRETTKWLLLIGIAFAFILGMTLFWNRRISKEIERRLATEVTLRESNEQLKTIFETSEAGIIMVSPKGVIEFANQRMAEMFGATLDELTGSSYPDHLHESEKLVGDDRMRRLINGDIQSVSHDRHYIRKDGTDFWGHLSGRRLENPDGTLRALVGVIADITDIKQAEYEKQIIATQLLHAQKLESLGILAGGIAHDFNNILVAIIGNTDLALMRINKDSPAVDNLNRIAAAASRAADLAKQMLAYSGKGKFVVENLDLNRILDEMLHMLELSISRKASLRLNKYQPLPTVEADATQIRQIIMNLVINASEAIGDNSGVISITTGFMECVRSYLQDAWLDDNIADGLYVFLEVTDTGCGMEKETLAKLFDPFFSTKFTGRGLGLSAVLGIVRGHKGAIKVYSEQNKGTTFRVLFPASSRPAELAIQNPLQDYSETS